MVERLRAADPKKTEPDNTSATPLFCCLPKPILWHPPIEHRGASDDGLLSVFDCAIAAAILALARRAMSSARYRHAMEAGRRSVEDREALGAVVAAAKRQDAEFSFKDHMADSYSAAHSNYESEVVTIVATRSALLTVAGVSRNGRNQDRLLDVLDRLREPVAVGRREWPPLLRSVKSLPKRKLKLIVSRRWLPRVIGTVPIPVPSRGANCLALFLFLAATDQRRGLAAGRNAHIDTQTLCRRIGITYRWRTEARTALVSALDAVNAHLRHLNRDGALMKLRLPVWFDLLWLNGGERLRFVANYGEQDMMDELPTRENEQPVDAEEEARRYRELERENSRLERENAEHRSREELRARMKRLRGEEV